MPSFKPKPSKKIVINSKSTVTLDSKHDEITSKINEEEANIEKLLLEKESIKKEIKNAKSLDKQLELKDKLKVLKNENKGNQK